MVFTYSERQLSPRAESRDSPCVEPMAHDCAWRGGTEPYWTEHGAASVHVAVHIGVHGHGHAEEASILWGASIAVTLQLHALALLCPALPCGLALPVTATGVRAAVCSMQPSRRRGAKY